MDLTQVEALITSLASKLSPMAQTVWDAALRQAQVRGQMYENIAYTIGFVFLGIELLLAIGFVRDCSSRWDNYHDEPSWITAMILLALLGAAVVLPFAWSAYVIQANPTWEAIRLLTEAGAAGKP